MSVTEAILTAKHAALDTNREPRYVILGETQWYALLHELRAEGVPITPLPLPRTYRVYGLDVVRVDEPDRLQIGY
jgi:hypothetical protein